MITRRLYVARHGAADASGELTAAGRRQVGLLGQRLAGIPIDVVWHSPLPRAATSAQVIAEHLPGAPVLEAPELIDHIPYVPSAEEIPPSWAGFFDGCAQAEAVAGQQVATALIARFGGITTADAASTPTGTHEILITHSNPIAWLVRHALDAPPARWLGLDSANAALTVLEHRSGLPPALVLFNEMSHLPAELRWTGFPDAVRP